MKFEDVIRRAFEESINDTRKGDTEEELEYIRNIILSARKIIVPNKNHVKTRVINEVLGQFDLPEAEHLHINTNSADLTRMPVISKALMAIDQCPCDLVIARGRLGVPGSGSMLVVMDSKGRILTGSLSPSHVVHKQSLETAVRSEITYSLKRIGLIECSENCFDKYKR